MVEQIASVISPAASHPAGRHPHFDDAAASCVRSLIQGEKLGVAKAGKPFLAGVREPSPQDGTASSNVGPGEGVWVTNTPALLPIEQCGVFATHSQYIRHHENHVERRDKNKPDRNPDGGTR